MRNNYSRTSGHKGMPEDEDRGGPVLPEAWKNAQEIENKLIMLIDSGEDLEDHYG